MGNPLNGMMNNSPDIRTMFNGFMKNPIQFLAQNKINIPAEYQNNPQEATQYLLNSGKMTQAQFNKISQIAKQMGVNLT